MRRKEHETEMVVRQAELSPDGRRVLLMFGDDWKVKGRGWSVWFDDPQNKPSIQEPLDPVVHLWDVGRDGMTQLVGHGNDVSTAHFTRDGKRIVTSSVDGTAKFWDVQGGAGAVKILQVGGDGLAIARFSPDGRWIAMARGQMPFWMHRNHERPPEGDGKTVRLWDVATGQQSAVLNGLVEVKDQGLRNNLLGNVVGLCFSPDGARLLIWSQDSKGKMKGPDGKEIPVPYTPVRLWDCEKGREAMTLEGLTQFPVAGAFSPDGRHLLTVAAGADVDVNTGNMAGGFRWGMGVKAIDRAQEWDVETTKPKSRFGPEDLVASALWAADNRRVYLFGKNAGQIWDALEGKHLADLEAASMPTAALSADGKRLVGYYPYHDLNRLEAVVWDAGTGKKTATLKGHEQEITAAVFSLDRQEIVTTSADSTVRVWNAVTGEQQLLLRSHTGPVRSAAFSPDGRFLATASDDGSARIWNTDTWTEWLTLSVHAGPVYGAEFSTDGQQVMTASRDGTARIWSVDPLPAARQRRPRELSSEERQRFGITGQPNGTTSP